MPRRLVVALVAAAALLAALLAVWVAWRAPLVPAIAVAPQPLTRTLLFSGRVATASRVELGATLTGRVREVRVREGDAVRQGEVLLRLEDAELRAALEQARASEQQARARLAGLRSTGRRAVEASLAQADSVLRAARADFERTQDLVSRGFVSEARLDEARRALAVAEAQQASARAQRAANADAGTDVSQAEAQLTQARSAVAAAQARLEQSTVLAPTEGRVIARSVEPGQIVQPGRALLTLVLAGPLELVGQVDERYLEQLTIGQPARVVADAAPSRPMRARVRSIAPLVDAQRGAVEVKLWPEGGTPAGLREDMTLSIEVETGRRDQALVVPIAALDAPPDAAGANVGANGDAARLRVLSDGRVQWREVRLGLRTLDAAEVRSGLSAGEIVLLGPAEPGQRARADLSREAAAATAGATSRDQAGPAMSNAMGR